MCVVSAIGNYAETTLPIAYPALSHYPAPFGYVTISEFEALKSEVQELKNLLLAGKSYDEKTNQPNCEMEDKIAFLKKVAEFVGVDLEDVFGKN